MARPNRKRPARRGNSLVPGVVLMVVMLHCFGILHLLIVRKHQQAVADSAASKAAKKYADLRPWTPSDLKYPTIAAMAHVVRLMIIMVIFAEGA